MSTGKKRASRYVGGLSLSASRLESERQQRRSAQQRSVSVLLRLRHSPTVRREPYMRHSEKRDVSSERRECSRPPRHEKREEQLELVRVRRRPPTSPAPPCRLCRWEQRSQSSALSRAP